MQHKQIIDKFTREVLSKYCGCVNALKNAAAIAW